MCNLSRVLARVLSILRWPEIHPLPGTASTPADIAVWLILTVPVLAGPKFFSSTFQHLTFSEGTPAFIGRGSGSQFNWEGLASFGHTQNLQFLLPIKGNRRHKEMSRKGMVSLFVSFSRGKIFDIFDARVDHLYHVWHFVAIGRVLHIFQVIGDKFQVLKNAAVKQ